MTSVIYRNFSMVKRLNQGTIFGKAGAFPKPVNQPPKIPLAKVISSVEIEPRSLDKAR